MFKKRRQSKAFQMKNKSLKKSWRFAHIGNTFRSGNKKPSKYSLAGNMPRKNRKMKFI